MTDPWTDIVAGHSRQNGVYAAQKLNFFDRYLPPAFAATRRKLTRHYVDLFAGPGVWHDPSGLRHLGSPLKVLSLSAEVAGSGGFTEVFLVNKDPKDHESLSARVEQMVDRGLTSLPRDRIHLVHGDANLHIGPILEQIHKKSWVLAYADIERPAHWPWTAVEALRAQGHESIDLYVLFPLHMAIRRILGYTVSHPEVITRFYGTDDWRPIAERRQTTAQARQFLREMEMFYADRLRAAGWGHVNRQRRISAVGARTLYYMLFATGHPVAKALSDWESVSGGDERHRDQGELF